MAFLFACFIDFFFFLIFSFSFFFPFNTFHLYFFTCHPCFSLLQFFFAYSLLM